MTRTSRVPRAAFIAACVAAAVSCGDVVRQGRSPVFLVVDSINVANGGSTSITYVSAPLLSDVLTKGSVFNDLGQAAIHLALKNIGTTTALTATSNNEVTLTRYHVDYVRADGHNTPGVDVPYGFDGAITATVPATGSAVTFGFELVRHDAKLESPLVQLVTNIQVINTIANITFYGQDQVGNVVSVTASVAVEFANFADPA